MNSNRKLKVLLVASEMTPFVKTGGLADVVGSLPVALNSLGGIDVRTIIPKYKYISDEEYDITELNHPIKFTIDNYEHEFRLKVKEMSGGWLSYFIDSGIFSDRDGIYGHNDDAWRFGFFSRSVIEMAKAINFKPDIIHCNDWHTGLIPAYLKTIYQDEPFFQDTKTIFTIHNLGYQGVFSKDLLPYLGLSWDEFKQEKLEFWDRISFIKGGLSYADFITTVSKKYSAEIQTPRYGENLHNLLRSRSDVLYGITNGLDYEEWNPATDIYIHRNYDSSNIEDKIHNKIQLQKENILPVSEEIPLLGVVSRLSPQKGLDIIADSIYELMSRNIQFILLGTGDEYYQDLFRRFGGEFRNSVSINLKFDLVMAKQIYAGSDIFLMPSRYEPCGLGQLISMRYGTIPVVRNTGGLSDTVQDYNSVTGSGTGFKFEHETSDGLLWAIGKALEVYSNKDKWKKLIKNAMNAKHSWKKSAGEYMELYRKITEDK
ncbi:glycogen synthase GlgA [Candidatus Poribacteria bacterium]|nr:glycogen synthase GlgA [Candidatus Poribacteria bacterium]